jgi:hypothetical protein
MLKKRYGFVVLAIVGVSVSAGVQEVPHASRRRSIQTHLVGTWELVSSEDLLSDGSR